jgi:hypothetical protein
MEDFKSLNLKIEQMSEEEILRIRQKVKELKYKALKIGEELFNSNPAIDDMKSSLPRKT